MGNRDRTTVWLLIIDVWELESGSYINCNTLRDHLELSSNGLYETETSVWQELSTGAIKAAVPFSVLSDGIFGRTFPSIFTSKDRELQSIRDTLSAIQINGSTPQSIASILVDDFSLEPDALFTKHLGVVLLGWRFGFTRCDTPTEVMKALAVGTKFQALMGKLDQYLFYSDSQRVILAEVGSVITPVLLQSTPSKAVERWRKHRLPTIGEWI